MAESAADAKGRPPPHSRESEMMVLGCMLTSMPALNVGADTLFAEDFYIPAHKQVFKVLQQFYRQDKPVDLHLVSEELKRQEQLQEVGGVAYLTQLAQYAGTSAYIEEYCQLVRSKAILRKMLRACQEIEQNALTEPDDVGSALDDAQQRLFQISQSVRSELGVQISELLSGVRSEHQRPFLEEVEIRQEQFRTRGGHEASITGIPTELYDLDRMIDGLGRSNMIILAARPAMGKTALALNIAERVCFNGSRPVGIFSLEMTAEQLLHRIICSQAEVESEKVKTGSLTGEEYQRIVAAVNGMSQHTMIIDDQPGLRITDLRARARRMREAYGIELLVIDYLQLITGSGSARNAESRQNEISEISRMLKTLARELNIPVLCLSQLSRKVEDRTQHRPMLSDLRESGCLAGDTEVELVDGTMRAMRQLAALQHPLLQVWASVNEQLIEAELVRGFYSGYRELYRLTAGGRTIRATGCHPFLTKGGWKRLDLIETGEELAIKQGHGLQWAAVESVIADGKDEVFDVTVAEVHNFVANGFVVHNSIEQDADIVAFLLRRDYYDPLDKPGMAELIVAKNRHGAVGTVHLTYRKEIAQFGNYTPLPPMKGASEGSGSNNAFADFASSLPT